MTLPGRNPSSPAEECSGLRGTGQKESGGTGPIKRHLSLAPHLLVAVAVIFGLVMLSREFWLAGPEVNDSIVHQELSRYIAENWSEQWPVDGWIPSFCTGFPVLSYYQPLSPLISAGLTRLLAISDARRTNAFFEYLLLALMPLSAYGSLRWLGLTSGTAASAAVLFTLLSSGHYGIGWDSYVWSSFGLTTQIWGLFFGFPALAVGYRVVTKERGPAVARELAGAGSLLSVCALSHFLTGYMVTISLAVLLFVPHPNIGWRRRLWRLGWIGALSGAALAFLVLPLLLTSENVLKTRWGADSKWDSHGWQWVMGRLLNGGLFDDANLPVITLLVALGMGLVLVVLRRKRDHLQT